MTLPDKVSVVVDRLTAVAPAHYYGFVAERGQDVLLATPGEKNPEKQPWKIEYYKDDSWQMLSLEKQVFKALQPGGQVIVRVVPTVAGVIPDQPYTLVLGSLPLMVKYDLHDEPGGVRIPSGRSTPDWLATQVYKEARLDVTFTDSKGTPLEGAMAYLYLEFANKDLPKISRQFMSDKEGKVSQFIDFGRCHGGRQAGAFEDKNRGFNKWDTYYEPGVYFVQNSLLGTPDKAPHLFYIGHICRQNLIKSTPVRN